MHYIYIYNLTVHKKPIHVYITLIKVYIAKDEMHWELGDKNLYKLVLPETDCAHNHSPNPQCIG